MYLRRESGETEVEKFPRGKTVSFQESSSSLPTANFLLFKQKKTSLPRKTFHLSEIFETVRNKKFQTLDDLTASKSSAYPQFICSSETTIRTLKLWNPLLGYCSYSSHFPKIKPRFPVQILGVCSVHKFIDNLCSILLTVSEPWIKREKFSKLVVRRPPNFL